MQKEEFNRLIQIIGLTIKTLAEAIARVQKIFAQWFYNVMLIKILNIFSDLCEFKIYSVILCWLGIYKLLQLEPSGNVADIIVYAGVAYTFISLFLREIQKPGSHIFLILLNMPPWSKAQINIPPDFFRKPKDSGNTSSEGEIR